MSERPEEVRLLEPLLPQLKPFEEVPAVTDQQFTLEELETEEWRPVPERPVDYSVSSLGRVRRDTSRTCAKAGRLLKLSLRDGKYLRACIGRLSCNVHRLVAAAFLGDCPSGHQVNHKDGNKTNNRLSNLEYVTPSENVRHARRLLGNWARRGSEHGIAKLTEAQIPVIRELIASGMLTHRAIGERFGVCAATIDNIKSGKVWSHVGHGNTSVS